MYCRWNLRSARAIGTRWRVLFLEEESTRPGSRMARYFIISRMADSAAPALRNYSSIETVRRISWERNPTIDGRLMPGMAITS